MLGRIGMRAHDYGEQNISTLCEMMKKDGYNTTQLALKKAIKGVQTIEEGLQDHIIEDIKHGLIDNQCSVSVFGAYLNYAHPDESIRLKNVQLFNKHLDYMNTINARVVGTETGSLDPHYRAHKDNHGDLGFNRLRQSIEAMIHHAEKVNGLVAIEGVSHHIIHTPKRMKQMIDAINHPRLQVIFDPTNLITTENYQYQEEIMKEMFDLLEEQIVVVHAKDFLIKSGEIVVVPPGEGLLNYSVFSKLVNQSKTVVDVLAENIPKDKLQEVSTFIREVF